MPPVWLVLLVVSIASADMARIGRNSVPPDWAGWGLISFVAGILVLPKLLIAALQVRAGKTRTIAGAALLFVSVFAELIVSTLTAPIVLMFQVRAVLRVLSGFDGGWPASNRTDSVLSLGQAWASSWWITCCGALGLAVVIAASPALLIWSLPVALPMILAPVFIALSSLPPRGLEALWRVPNERTPSLVQREWQTIHDRWTGPAGELGQQFTQSETADVLG
jgi:membrane glycosyltransferase